MNNTAATKPQPSPLVKIAGRDIDLTKAFPLTLGDWEFFEKEGVFTEDGKLVKGIRPILTMLSHLARKIDTAITDEQVRQIPLNGLKAISDSIGVLVTADLGEAAENPTSAT